jgi:hypothetical protein
VLLGALLVCVAAAGVSAPASAAPVPANPCQYAFPGAKARDVGRTTLYNFQESVRQVVCSGFGLNPDTGVSISSDFVCALAAVAIGTTKAEQLELYADGACSAAAIAKDPKEPATYIGIACGWASDILGKLDKAAGILGGLGCALAPEVGSNLGGALESNHEIDVANDILTKGKCLKYSPSHFGSPWLAVACAKDDKGFSNLLRVLGTISVSGSTDAGYRVSLGTHLLPTTLRAMKSSFGEPDSLRRSGSRFDPFCTATWSAHAVSATFFHGYGGPPPDLEAGRRLPACDVYYGTFTATFGKGWRTARGLAVGATASAVQKLYPEAYSQRSQWVLVAAPTPWSSTIVVLGANMKNGKVGSFTVAGPESWDE